MTPIVASPRAIPSTSPLELTFATVGSDVEYSVTILADGARLSTETAIVVVSPTAIVFDPAAAENDRAP
jgi:hypothetical protein